MMNMSHHVMLVTHLVNTPQIPPRPLNSTQKWAWQVFLVMPIKLEALAHLRVRHFLVYFKVPDT